MRCCAFAACRGVCVGVVCGGRACRSVGVSVGVGWFWYPPLSLSLPFNDFLEPHALLGGQITRNLCDTALAGITSRQVNVARRPHTCSRPCAFQGKIKIWGKNTKSCRTQNTPRNPQQPGNRNHLETACTERRPTR